MSCPIANKHLWETPQQRYMINNYHIYTFYNTNQNERCQYISLPFRSPPATCEPVRSHVFPHEHYRRPSPSLYLSRQVHLQSELNPVISYSLVSEIRAHNFQRFELKRTYVSNGYAKSRTPHHSITSPPSPKSTLLPIQKNNVLCIPHPISHYPLFFFSVPKNNKCSVSI
jgi:hypothetical protein